MAGVIAFEVLSSHTWCSVWFGMISASILFILGLTTTFHSMAILAYIDFASISLAVLVTIIFAAIESSQKPGGIQATPWYAFPPKENLPSFTDSMIA